MAKLPRILYIGAEALSASHGTGFMFARHFARYPRAKIVDVHYRAFADDRLFRSKYIPMHPLQRSTLNDRICGDINKAMLTGKRVKGQSLVYQDVVFGSSIIDWKKFGGPPDLIYSTCYQAADFAFLHHVYRGLEKKVPILQHFLDFDKKYFHHIEDLVREMSPAMTEVWALNEPLRGVAERLTGRKVEIRSALQQPLSRIHKKDHREQSKNFNAIMVGNVWSASAFVTTRSLWSECQEQIRGGLRPIDWYGHKRRFLELEEREVFLREDDPVIRDRGFVAAAKLKKLLIDADMAIVAFSGEDDSDEKDYNRFSLPSRIGDYCAAGQAIVTIARPDTEPARYTREFGIGIVLDPTEWRKSIQKLKHFVLDREWRAECGLRAREFAEGALNLEAYQTDLYPRLTRIASAEIPRQQLQRQFAP